MKYLIIILIIFVPMFVFGHGNGLALTTEQDGYQIDIDLDTLTPKSDTGIRFDFDLLDIGGKGLETNFDYVWVRIQKGQKTVFAGGIGRPDFGPVGVTTTLPEGGTYIISARFQNDGQEIVEGSISFDVKDSSTSDSNSSFFGFLFTTQFFLGLVIGALLIFIFGNLFKK